MKKTNEQVQAGVVKHWKRQARQHNMTVDEYHAYRKEQAEQKRKEWGSSMAAAITVDDARSLLKDAQKLVEEAKFVLYYVSLKRNGYEGMSKDYLAKEICALYDRLHLVTAVLDRIDENRHH